MAVTSQDLRFPFFPLASIVQFTAINKCVFFYKPHQTEGQTLSCMGQEPQNQVDRALSWRDQLSGNGGQTRMQTSGSKADDRPAGGDPYYAY